MRNILSFLLLLAISQIAYSQDITGLWKSEDGTRIYEIKNINHQYTATLIKSTRPRDKAGALILEKVTYNESKDQFAGTIISTDDTTAAYTKIRFKKDILHFRIRRMFITSVKIRWLRVS
jgi:uncharacterized protein (DUF2147 family)